MKTIRLLAMLLAVLCAASIASPASAQSPAAAPEGKPELLSVKKIWDQAPHNSFTDLIRVKDQFLCTFRESQAHVGGDGKIRVLASPDGERWESLALLAEDGIDLRDPKLSVMPDGRLMLLMGGSVYKGTKTLQGRQPRVSFSQDGREWTAPQRILSDGEWLWRVTWHEGTAYGVSYHSEAQPAAQGKEKTKGKDKGKNQGKNKTKGKGNNTAAGPDWALRLFSTTDGIHYTLVTSLKVPDHPNETTLRFLANGEIAALVRRETADQQGWIGHSRAPYRDWQWAPCGQRLGGPNFIEVPGGALWAGTRQHLPAPQGAKTMLARLDLGSLTPALTLPSGGDCSYPGLLWHNGLLWMSYYSSHEGKTSIYLAKIRLPGMAQ